MGLIKKFINYASKVQDEFMSGALEQYQYFMDYSDEGAAGIIIDEYKELKEQLERCRKSNNTGRSPRYIARIIACKYYLVLKCKWPVSAAESIDQDISWTQIQKNGIGSIQEAIDLAVDDEYDAMEDYSKEDILEMEPTSNHYKIIAAIAMLVYEYDMPYNQAQHIMEEYLLDDYYSAGSTSYMGDDTLAELSKASFYNYENIESNFEKTEEMYANNSSTSEGCYITTAVCQSFNKPDDCIELQTFRKFRDNYLAKSEKGYEMIQEYYSTAPKIVKKINEMDNSRDIYHGIWNKYLKSCFDYIKEGKYEECKSLYYYMVKKLEKKFL